MRNWARRLRGLTVLALLAALVMPLLLADEVWLIASPGLCVLAAIFHILAGMLERRARKRQEMLGRFDWQG